MNNMHTRYAYACCATNLSVCSCIFLKL